MSVASSAILRASSAVVPCANSVQGNVISSRRKLSLLAITVLDIPTYGFQEVDPPEQSDGCKHARGYRQEEPIESRIDDADRIVPHDVRIVFRIQPRAARQLQQTEGIDQHTPEVRNGGAAAGW